MKQKLIKQFENGTDFSVCVIALENGTYVVTIYDFVKKQHDLKGKYTNANEALDAARKINQGFMEPKKRTIRLNESQLKQVIRESIKKVLKESFATDMDLRGYGSSRFDYPSEKDYYDAMTDKGYYSLVNSNREVIKYGFYDITDAINSLTRLINNGDFNFKSGNAIVINNETGESLCEVSIDGVKDLRNGTFETWKEYYKKGYC